MPHPSNSTLPAPGTQQLPITKPEPINKFIWADYLRVAATCSVVFLHFAGPGVYASVGSTNYWVGHVFDSAVRACVPLFVMLTGALVLPSERSLPDYLKKRMGRILLPFLFWSVIYLAYSYYVKRGTAEAVTGVGATVKWVYWNMQAGAFHHLWYVYMIVGIYLIIPIIGRWARAATEQEIQYFLGIWLVTLFANYPLCAKYGFSLNLQYFAGYVGYLVLGYYLTRLSINHNVGRRIALVAIAVGWAVTILGTHYVSQQNHKFVAYFYEYLTPNVFLMAAGIFYLFRQLTLPALKGIPKFIAQNSYNIYLGHMLVLSLLMRNGIDGYAVHPAIGVPAVTGVCLMLTSAMVWVLNKTYVGKRISG